MPEEHVRLAALAIAHLSFLLVQVFVLALMAVCLTVIRNELRGLPNPRRR